MAGSSLVVPGITDPGALACISRARRYSQYCQMVKDTLASKCPFCAPLDPKYNKVIIENDHFYSWQSSSPEKHTKHHFIIVPKKHVTDSEEFSIPQILHFHEMKRALRKQFGYKSRGELIRDGDATMSAGTIQHWHAHIMVPDGTGRVESPFYKGAEAEALSLARAIVFEKVRQTCLNGFGSKEAVALLSPADQATVNGIMD